MQESAKIAVGVIGTGRMGRLHLKTYANMPRAQIVGIYDALGSSAASAATEYKTQIFTSLDELLGKVRAVTIAANTASHLDLAKKCIAAGVACLIEKPLAVNSNECREIVELSRKHKVLVQVGHIERFNPAVRAMFALEIKPRFIEAIRISPLTFRSMDVGVVLDIMIHDLDIVLQLAGSKVKAIDATGVSVAGKVEDICNARIRFENGCVANVTASRLAMKTERRLRVFADSAFVSVDYQKRSGIVLRKGQNIDRIRETVAKVKAGEVADLSQLNYLDMLKTEELKTDGMDPLRAEQEAFLDAVEGKRPCAVPAEAGFAAVETAEKIIAQIAGVAV